MYKYLFFLMIGFSFSSHAMHESKPTENFLEHPTDPIIAELFLPLKKSVDEKEIKKLLNKLSSFKSKNNYLDVISLFEELFSNTSNHKIATMDLSMMHWAVIFDIYRCTTNRPNSVMLEKAKKVLFDNNLKNKINFFYHFLFESIAMYSDEQKLSKELNIFLDIKNKEKARSLLKNMDFYELSQVIYYFNNNDQPYLNKFLLKLCDKYNDQYYVNIFIALLLHFSNDKILYKALSIWQDNCKKQSFEELQSLLPLAKLMPRFPIPLCERLLEESFNRMSEDIISHMQDWLKVYGESYYQYRYERAKPSFFLDFAYKIKAAKKAGIYRKNLYIKALKHYVEISDYEVLSIVDTLDFNKEASLYSFVVNDLHLWENSSVRKQIIEALIVYAISDVDEHAYKVIELLDNIKSFQIRFNNSEQDVQDIVNAMIKIFTIMLKNSHATQNCSVSVFLFLMKKSQILSPEIAPHLLDYAKKDKNLLKDRIVILMALWDAAPDFCTLHASKLKKLADKLLLQRPGYSLEKKLKEFIELL